MKKPFGPVLGRCAMAFAVFHPLASAQTWTYPGCKDVTDADFTYTTIVHRGQQPDPNLAEPDKMDFDMDAQGNVDIYYTEIRPGNIKRYSAATRTVKTLVKLPNWGLGSDYTVMKNGNNVEEGVTGIALDPDFKKNHYLYIHWSPLPNNLEVFRISRFTVTGDTILMSSEKVVLEIPAQRQSCCHTGGAMQFDAYGDLWIAQGANGGRSGTNTTTPPEGMDENKKYESEEWGASSTHGLRGSILRIHPTEDGKYTIPAGNFGDYFFKQTGKPEYADTSKVLPEIFIKGNRNPYSLALDPVRRWVAWGDIGPDVLSGGVREELNLRRTPGFEGWPYFVGRNTPFSGGKNADAPTNTSHWNTGLTALPPARPAFYLHTIGTSPITGPLYRYDGDLNSSVKLPPHFNRKLFVTDWGTSQVSVLSLDSAGNTVTGAQKIFANHPFSNPTDFRQGPDGALYVLNYGPGFFNANGSASIEKISYKGDCRPSTPKLEQAVSLARRPGGSVDERPSGMLANLGADRVVLVPQGMIGFELFDMNGKRVWDAGSLRGGRSFRLPADMQAGALKYRWTPERR
jgi:glucose/arabinose dehydrogenase